MLELKHLDEIFEADGWHAVSPLFGSGDVERPKSLADLHRAVSHFDIPSSSPPEVRVPFELSRNLLVYSWFVFEFSTASEFYAYAAVEAALRFRTGEGPDGGPGLAKLLRDALDAGWLVDDQLRRGRERLQEWEDRAEERQALAAIGIRYQPIDDDPQFRSKILASVFPKLRNYLAHGNVPRFRGALSTLEECAEIVAQLFPEVGPSPESGS